LNIHIFSNYISGSGATALPLFIIIVHFNPKTSMALLFLRKWAFPVSGYTVYA